MREVRPVMSTTLSRRHVLAGLAGIGGIMAGYEQDAGAVGKRADDEVASQKTTIGSQQTTIDEQAAYIKELEDQIAGGGGGTPDTRLMVGLDMASYALYTGSDPAVPGEPILGPSYLGRTFSDPGQSATIIAKGANASILDASQAKPYRQNNEHQMYSMKPDITKATNGDKQTLDAIAGIAKSMLDGDLFTVYHEPENDMTADKWWGMFARVYDAAKNARPGLSVGYCAMTYQHGTGQAAAGLSDQWCRDAPCDFFGADDYGPHPYSGKNFDIPLGNKQNFQAWYTAAAKHAGPDKGRALRINEIGRSGKDPAAVAVRPKVLTDAFKWCTDHGFDAFMYWNSSTGQSGTAWPLDDKGSRDAWAAIVAQGKPATVSVVDVNATATDSDRHTAADAGG